MSSDRDTPPEPEESASSDGPVDLPAGATGPDLARAVLDAAKARRAERQKSGGGRTGGRRARRGRGWSGPGPDPRDPQSFGSLLAKLVADRGWERPAAEASLFASWDKVVGPDIAQHCRPVSLTDGELTVEAESTAWATQLRLLNSKIMAKIAAEIRPSPVRRLRIHGPVAPSWSRGRLRVRGPGPGDTYG